MHEVDASLSLPDGAPVGPRPEKCGVLLTAQVTHLIPVTVLALTYVQTIFLFVCLIVLFHVPYHLNQCSPT